MVLIDWFWIVITEMNGFTAVAMKYEKRLVMQSHFAVCVSDGRNNWIRLLEC